MEEEMEDFPELDYSEFVKMEEEMEDNPKLDFSKLVNMENIMGYPELDFKMQDNVDTQKPIDDCKKFYKLPYRNPKDESDFNLESKEYQDWKNSCKLAYDKKLISPPYCKQFFKNPSINPITTKPMQNEFIDFYQTCGYNSFDVLTDFSPYDVSGNFNINCTGYFDGLTFNWIQAQAAYQKTLSEEDNRLIFKYSSPTAFQWNNMLRGSNACDIGSNESVETIQNEIIKFYNIIMKAPKTPDMIVYRGEIRKKFDTFFEPFSNNKQVARFGFISTTICQNQAIQYAIKKFSSAGYIDIDDTKEIPSLSKIFLPQGTPALFMFRQNIENNMFKFDLDQVGNGYDERMEIVLPPHILKFETEVKEDGYDFSKFTFLAVEPIDIFKFDVVKKQEAMIKHIVKYLREGFYKTENFDHSTYVVQRKLPFNWIVKGGYGINKLLEHRYKMKNLNPTNDLDIALYFENPNLFKKFLTDFEKFMNKLCEKFEPRLKLYITNENLKFGNWVLFQIKYAICIEQKQKLVDNDFTDLVDIKVELGDLFNTKFIDNDLSGYLGMPIKNIEGYLQETQDLLKRAIHKKNKSGLALDEKTYKDRNPIIGKRKEKGIKALVRAKDLCSVDKYGRNLEAYKNMCRILEENQLNDLLYKNKAETLSDTFSVANNALGL